MFEKTEGVLGSVAGRIQEAYGAATGNTGAEIEGKARRVAGEAQSLYGDTLNRFRESAVRHPVGTFAAVAGLAFVLGALSTRR